MKSRNWPDITEQLKRDSVVLLWWKLVELLWWEITWPQSAVFTMTRNATVKHWRSGYLWQHGYQLLHEHLSKSFLRGVTDLYEKKKNKGQNERQQAASWVQQTKRYLLTYEHIKGDLTCRFQFSVLFINFFRNFWTFCQVGFTSSKWSRWKAVLLYLCWVS